MWTKLWQCQTKVGVICNLPKNWKLTQRFLDLPFLNMELFSYLSNSLTSQWIMFVAVILSKTMFVAVSMWLWDCVNCVFRYLHFFFFFSIQMIVSLCVWICVIYTNNLWLCLEWHFCYYYLGPKIKSLELWNLGIVVLFGSTKGLFKCFFFFHINCFWVILRTQVFSSLANMKNYDWSNITFTGSTIDTTFIIH